MNKLLFILVGWLLALSVAAEPEEGGVRLPVTEVFKLQAQVVDSHRVRLDWDIAEGYFVFRNKFRFQSATDGIELGGIDYPPGEVLQDPFFGNLEVYRQRLSLELPLKRAPGSGDQLSLKLAMQGCVTLSQCYPSHLEQLKLDLPATADSALQPSASVAPPVEPAEPTPPITAAATVASNDSEDNFLDPEVAFLFSSELVKPDLIALRWQIADGYYLYRKQLKFEPQQFAELVGEAQIPEGELKHDEFFGEVEVYHRDLEVLLPLHNNDSAAKALPIKVSYQGCAEAGLCYPPQEKTPVFQLRTSVADLFQIREKQTASAVPASLASPAPKPQGLGGLNETELLDPEQAFVFSASLEDGFIAAHWQVAPGYYLYRDKLKLSLRGGQAGVPEFPAGEMKQDPTYGQVEVYYNQVLVKLPLAPGFAGLELDVEYQGCAEVGLCYPPQEKTVRLATGQTAAGSGARSQAAPPLSEQDQLKQTLGGNKLWALLVFFGLGLMLALTPCVFPMIPILSSIIVGQGKELTTRKAFIMSLVYVLAMAFTYTIAGVLTALAGENLQAAFQNPWVLSSFAVLFVVLSLSMFGFYELQMPASVQSKLTELSNSQQGGTLIGVAIMGFLSALIVGPCVTAPLVGALLYISQTGDALFGGAALFALSMGMGVPLLLIGVSAGKFLPRAGAWMDTVKYIFGILMLALAVWMVRPLLSMQVILLLSAVLLVIPAVYLGALENLPPNSSGWRKLSKGVGVLLLSYGLLLLVGAASGADSLLRPLGKLGATAGGAVSSGASSQQHALPFVQIKGVAGLQAELAKAKAAGKPVMLDFYADWCVSCLEMEQFTFSDPEVQAALSEVVVLQADVTPNDAEDKALYKHFGIFGPPSIMFYDSDGNELKDYRVVGFKPAAEFRPHIRQALGR